MNRIGNVLVYGRGRNVCRHDENSDTPFRQSCLASDDGLATGLFRRIDHVAEDAAALVDLLEVNLLDEVKAQFVANDLARDQHDRRTVSVGLEYPVDEMQTAGAATSGHGRQLTGQLCLGL